MLLLVAGCARPVPAPTAALSAGAIPLALCGRFAGPADAPPSLQAAEPAFTRAHAAYDDSEYAHAAEHFGRAANILREDEAHDHEVVLRNRRVAYANMVLAWLSVDGVDRARASLQAAAIDDPDLRADLERTAAALPDPPSCDLRPGEHDDE